MQCPNCGAHATQEDVFCAECGELLLEEEDFVEPAAPAEAGLQETTEVSPPAQPPPAEKKRACRLPVILGLGCMLLIGGTALLFGLFGVGIANRSPVAPTAAVPATGRLIYKEDFADPGSGWDVYSEDDTWADYVAGEYGLAVLEPELVTWGTPEDQWFANFALEVDARQVEGPLDNNLGLLVRYQPGGEDFYWFQISADGYYSVDLLRDDEWSTMVGWIESEAINEGLEATNHLKVVCHDDQFSFYVNDTYLTSVTEDTFGSGNIGLAVGTFDEPGVVVHFDNLQVYALED